MDKSIIIEPKSKTKWYETVTSRDSKYDDLYPDKHRVCIMKREDMLKISDILYETGYDITPKNLYLMVNLIVKNLKYLSDINFSNEIIPYDWMIILNFYLDKINNNDTDKPIEFLDHIIKDGEELYGMIFSDDDNVVENRWVSTLMNVLAINRPEIKIIK